MARRSWWSANPFWSDFERMRNEMEALFNPSSYSREGIRNSLQAFPPVSMCETNEDVRVYTFAPGIDPKQCEVSLQGGVLTISATRDQCFDPFTNTVNEKWEKAACYRNERSWGTFTRAIGLPEQVDPNQVHATYEDGILTVLVGKRAEVQPKRIEIKAK